MGKIQTPVKYDHIVESIYDADGNFIFGIGDADVQNDELRSLGEEITQAINESARLRKELKAANKGAQTNALINQSLSKQLWELRKKLAAAEEKRDMWLRIAQRLFKERQTMLHGHVYDLPTDDVILEATILEAIIDGKDVE